MRGVKLSWMLFLISGFMILFGIPGFWTGNFLYWLVPRAIFALGAVLFWVER